MAVSTVPAGTRLEIIAAAASEGSPLLRMMSGRDHRTFVTDRDPRKAGYDVGSWFHNERGLFTGRIVSIHDNEDPSDWLSTPTEWYVTIEKPWNQSHVQTTIGKAKIQWMEDEMFPRVGTILSDEPGSYFRAGDIVRLVGPEQRRKDDRPWWRRLLG